MNNMAKYKSGDIVITTADHVIKIIGIDKEWNKRTDNDLTYYTFEMAKQSNAWYMSERITDNNIVGFYRKGEK